MTPKALFRLMVAIMLLGAVGSTLAAIFPGNIGEEWRTAQELNGNGGIYERFADFELPTHAIARASVTGLLVILVLFLLSVYVGLFFFWRFARLFNVLLTVLFIVIAPWAGLVVLLPIEAGLYDFTMLCEGAVFTLSYSSPIKSLFESP